MIPNVSNLDLELANDNIVFDLIEDKLDAGEHTEGDAIMAGLTGFGAKLTNTQANMGYSKATIIKNQQVFVRITEQPASNKLRFR